MDPRYLQLASLGALLTYGLFGLDFEVRPANAVVIAITAQVVQYLADTRQGRRWDPRSAAITTLSLCLLLRTNSVFVAGLASAVAIGSKSLLRINGKHVFNPANLGIVVAVLATGQAWISSGQWGNEALLGLLFACLGITVVTRSERADITYAFLGFYAAMLFYRSWSVNEPVTIPLHRLQSGALLLFAFFMISDPKTTPDSRLGRILFAFLVVVGAYVVQFKYFVPNALIWSLVALCPTVPLIDRLLPADRYQWRSTPAPTPALVPST
jgi:Na+-transporting NADH:ubiquinone oxidoreductase subunit NqrB